VNPNPYLIITPPAEKSGLIGELWVIVRV